MQKNDAKSALSRRAFVGRLAAGAAGAAVALAAGVKGAEALSTPAVGELGDGGERRGPQAAGAETQRAEKVGAQESPSTAKASTPESTILAPDAPPPWQLVQPLRKGSRVAYGWRVADLSPVVDGSFVLTLANRRGRTYRVHVCRNGGRPAGLVYTRQLDLVVMNGGQGELPTEEGLAQAVAEVAHVLATNEGKWRGAPVMTALLPQAERIRKYGAAAKLR